MTADQRLAQILKKVDRAKHHCAELVTELAAFRDTNPFVIDAKRDPATRRLIYYLASVKEIPDELPLVIGDILHNLRSSLDHLAYQLFKIATGGTEDDFRVQFPIGKDVNDYGNKRVRIQELRQDAIDAIDKLQPYRGGNDLLWRIHELNNVDKHRLLVTVGSAFRSLDIGAHGRHLAIQANPELAKFPELPLFLTSGDKMFPLKAGAELFIDGPDATPVPKMEFRFEICLNEPPVIDAAPLPRALGELINEVERIVTDFRPLLS